MKFVTKEPLMMNSTLMLFSMNAALADVPLKAAVRVPSIEEVVVKEGFTPTPSQSDIYRPGAVLVPNDRGGHDMVVENCVSTEPTISLMSQSSIATSLSAGVTARLAVARGEVASGVERRLSFVDPEQRTLPLGRLTPTDVCAREVRSAGRIRPLTDAFIVQDVLVAQIKNTVCTMADASGRVAILGEAEAAAYSECIQESDGQVPLGYKSVPWTSLSTAPNPMGTASVNSGVTFDVPDLGVDDMLDQQACQAAADKTAATQREARMSALVLDAQAKAADAWAKISPQVEKCATVQDVALRAPCIQAVEGWLDKASSMLVTLPAGVERVATECGPLDVAFPAANQNVIAADVRAAEEAENKLKQASLSSVEYQKMLAAYNRYVKVNWTSDDFKNSELILSKYEELKVLETMSSAIVATQDLEVSTGALVLAGKASFALSDMLLDMPLSQGLSEEDQMLIREEVGKHRTSLDNRGKSFLLAALDTGHKQGSWGQFQKEALAYLAERYPKEFRAYSEN